MRNGRGGKARLPTVFASASASARTEGISGTLVPRSPCRTHRFCLSGGAFLWFAALANECTGTASEPRPHCRRPGYPGKAMSEAALAPYASQRAHLASAHARRNRLSPLEALERG